MDMATHTGGAAFPIAGYDGVELHVRDEGMTLRDYFAAQIMCGLAAHSGFAPEANARHRAEEAYRQADALIARRRLTTAA